MKKAMMNWTGVATIPSLFYFIGIGIGPIEGGNDCRHTGQRIVRVRVRFEVDRPLFVGDDRFMEGNLDHRLQPPLPASPGH